MKSYKRTLSIAGFDGSGGAGIQADLKTFSALGCYGMSVLTSLPVQNTTGVKSIYEIPLKCIIEQCDSIFDDIGVDAVKIGMLHDAKIIKAIASLLKRHMPLKIVLDPVMVAKSGDRLLKEDAVDALKEYLLPLATIITPNLPEVSDLLGRNISSEIDMESAAQSLSQLGPSSVVVKGGHLSGEKSQDCLFVKESGEVSWFFSDRFKTKNTHGTGCTFSAAITSFLAMDHSIKDSVEMAKEYISNAIKEGAKYKVGFGCGPVHHFYHFWD